MPVDVSFNPSGVRAALVFRETPGNILTRDLVAEIRAVLEDLQYTPALRLLAIEGAGNDFSFGASVSEHAPDRIAQVLPEFHALIRELVTLPVATAAVVRGRCLGGGFELALACDFVCAADDASFGLPEIALGVFPPAASVLLPVRAGAGRSTRAILAGEATSAAEWRRAGVVSWSAPAGELDEAVSAWFDRTLGRYSAEALRHAVRVARLPVAAAIERHLDEIEQLYLNDLMLTHDAREGVQAFIERRPPHWRNE
jgi:cyclohexa-1,5-dienecarbonyl-CoA hydratase